MRRKQSCVRCRFNRTNSLLFRPQPTCQPILRLSNGKNPDSGLSLLSYDSMTLGMKNKKLGPSCDVKGFVTFLLFIDVMLDHSILLILFIVFNFHSESLTVTASQHLMNMILP